jgi:hypothetical protein
LRQGAKTRRGPSRRVFGGIYSSTRQAIKGPAFVQGRKLYIYPEQYEGQESDPLIFCTGPVPAQQVEPLIPWLMNTRVRRSLHHRPITSGRTMNKKVPGRTANGGAIVGEVLPLDHTDYSKTVEKIMASDTGWCSTPRYRRGWRPPRTAYSGFTKRGGHQSARTSRRTSQLPAGRAHGHVQLSRLLPSVSVRSAAKNSIGTLRLPRQRQVHRRQRVLRPVGG